MKRLRLVFSIAAVSAVLIGYATHQRRTLVALEKKQLELSASVDLAERNAQTARLEHVALAALTRPAGARSEAAPPTEAAAPAAPLATAEPASAPPPDRAEYTANIDSSFATETADASWGQLADAAVRSRLAAHDDRSLRSVECRATMCRVITDDDGVETAGEKIRAVIGNPGDEVWSGAYFSHLEGTENGRPQRVTYFFRKGVALPML
jgi:hypothetical protein